MQKILVTTFYTTQNYVFMIFSDSSSSAVPNDAIGCTFRLLTLSQTTKFRLFQIERLLQMTILTVMKMAELSQKG